MSENLMTTEQAAEQLNVSYDWLKKAAQRRTVPHTRMGRLVRFTPAQIQEIVAQGERQAIGLPRGISRSPSRL